MKKKILIVSKTFYPINTPRSFRATELVKEFARQGHEVTLYTIKDDAIHVPFEKQFGVTIKSLGQLRLHALDNSAGGKIISLIKRMINRGLNLLFEYPDIELMFKVRKVLVKESGYDLLISIAVPHPVHWGVAWATRSNSKIARTWVADCGDPYMGERTDSFRKLFYFKYFEKWFGRLANYIAITNINMRNNYYPEFHHKIVEITQGFNFEMTKEKLPEYKPNRIPTFAYAGTFIQRARDPRVLLEYLVNLDVMFKLIIFTEQKHLVEPYLAAGKGRIVIQDQVPRMELLEVLCKMDFLLNISYDVSVQSPSKLIDYYLVGRPVLSLQSNEVNMPVLQEFLNGNYTNAFVFENYEKFKIENVCGQFLQLISKPTSPIA